MTVTPETMLAQGSEHVETLVGDQVMMMHIQQGKYFALDGTARRIWEMLKMPTTVDGLVEQLVGEYDIDTEACRADISGFVSELMENGLIVEQKGEREA